MASETGLYLLGFGSGLFVWFMWAKGFKIFDDMMDKFFDKITNQTSGQARRE